LGAQQVFGIDNDPQAITASHDNAVRNGVSAPQFSASLPEAAALESWRGSADWVVANILAGPLIELERTLTTLMAPRSRLLLAGLLEEQAEQIMAAYAPNVTLAIADQQEEWVLLAGERRSP
jgi:ribosomal protein L11 methyltransferase